MIAAVVDANVFIYAVFNVPGVGGDAKEVLRRVDEVHAPASLLAELVSTVWQKAKRGEVTPADGRTGLAAFPALIDRTADVAALWDRALDLSLAKDHSPYDTLFVALAEREGLRVVTFDRTLARKFPTHCVEPAAFLAGPPVPPPSPRP